MQRIIVWLRRDLRLNDNAAIYKAASLGGEIIPIFIFDQDILKNFQIKNDRRVNFILRTIKHLNDNLKKDHNSGILVYYGSASKLIPEIAKNFKAQAICAGESYETYDINRDQTVKNELANQGVEFHLVKDHLLKAPNEVLKDSQEPFVVYTPYSKKFYSTISPSDYSEFNCSHAKFSELKNLPPNTFNNALKIDLDQSDQEIMRSMNYEIFEENLWNHKFSSLDVNNFLENKLSEYATGRDFLAESATSRFSVYLRFGLVSVRELYRKAFNLPNYSKWVNELIWREFYASILFHFPNTSYEEFQPQYRSLEWIDDADAFYKFENAQTGFPIIDAAMIQLKQEGWVHNRARMIVASFLTKNLLQNWKLGEKLYSQYLMDYEAASNIGGWQWAASTGTDAAPYFRIFNPLLQAKKFDPDGKYVKKYLPSLKDVPCSFIHEPKLFDPTLKYPNQMLDLNLTRNRALEFFKVKQSASN